MSLIRAGSFNISGQASLERPRPTPDNEEVGVVDAVIFCSRPVQKSCMVACSLRYRKPPTDEELREGIYDISANVRFTRVTFFEEQDNELTVHRSYHFVLM